MKSELDMWVQKWGVRLLEVGFYWRIYGSLLISTSVIQVFFMYRILPNKDTGRVRKVTSNVVGKELRF